MTKKIPVGWYLKQIINPPAEPKKRKTKDLITSSPINSITNLSDYDDTRPHQEMDTTKFEGYVK